MAPEVKSISVRLWSDDVWRLVARYPDISHASSLSMPYVYIRIWLVSAFEHAETNGGKLWPPNGVGDDPFFDLADCLLDSEDEVIAP